MDEVTYRSIGKLVFGVVVPVAFTVWCVALGASTSLGGLIVMGLFAIVVMAPYVWFLTLKHCYRAVLATDGTLRLSYLLHRERVSVASIREIRTELRAGLRASVFRVIYEGGDVLLNSEKPAAIRIVEALKRSKPSLKVSEVAEPGFGTLGGGGGYGV